MSSKNSQEPRFKELRRARRTALSRLKGQLEIYKYLDDTRSNVIRVRDISPFGICVLLSQPITDEAYVRLTYIDNGNPLSVDGTVVWRRRTRMTNEDGVTLICSWTGIFLHPWRIQANLDFYQAIVGRHWSRRS